jgi:hypothetical protein
MTYYKKTKVAKDRGNNDAKQAALLNANRRLPVWMQEARRFSPSLNGRRHKSSAARDRAQRRSKTQSLRFPKAPIP